MAFRVAVLLLASPNPSHAQVVYTPGTLSMLHACFGEKLYTRQNADAPSEIRQALQVVSDKFAFRSCKDAEGNTHYWVRAPRPIRNGVCRIYEQEIFPAAASESAGIEVLYDGVAPNHYIELSGWTSMPGAPWIARSYRPQSNAVFGLLASGDCPNGADAKYIRIYNLPEGIHKAFLEYWGQITHSPQEFNDVISKVPAAEGVNGLETSTPSPLFAKWLSDAVFKNHSSFASIGCGDLGCSASISVVEVHFDFDLHGIKLTSLRVPPVP